jgi:transposase
MGHFTRQKNNNPDNIILIFLPLYSPELNGAEKVWWVIKRETNLCTFESLDELENKLDEIIKKKITLKKISKLTAYKDFLSPYKTI